jgi:hypothetical protein
MAEEGQIWMHYDHAGRARGRLEIEVDPISDMRRSGDAISML